MSYGTVKLLLHGPYPQVPIRLHEERSSYQLPIMPTAMGQARAVGAVPARSAAGACCRGRAVRRNARATLSNSTHALHALPSLSRGGSSLHGSRASAAWGSRLSLSVSSAATLRRTASRGFQPVRAVFEKFTERAIKAVMLAQQEAKNLGVLEVRSRRLHD